MTAESLVFPVLSAVAGFICWMAIPLLGFSMLQLIGRK
jgi:hypothetical protein